MELDISEIDSFVGSAVYRPKITIAMDFSGMNSAPRDGRRIYAWSGGYKGEEEWIPIYWSDNEWKRLDSGGSWLSGDTHWNDTLQVWCELPDIIKTQSNENLKTEDKACK